jgi:hypothetical protein
MFSKALRTTPGRLYSLYMLRLSGVVAVLSAALTYALFACIPPAAADASNSGPGYALEGFHWRCGVPITWTTPNAKLKAWATPVIEQLRQITAIDLEWTNSRPANIQISWNKRDPHFLNPQTSAAITYLPSEPEFAGVSGVKIPQALIRLNPRVLLAKGVSPRHHREGATWVLRHELGHAIGLDHVHQGKEVMADGLTSEVASDYQPGDIAGLKVLGCNHGDGASGPTPCPIESAAADGTTADSTNLVTNPSFETSTAGWAAGVGTVCITRYTGSGIDGSAMLAVTSAGTSPSFVISDAMPISAGTSYVARASFQYGAPAATGITVRWYSDAAGTAQIGPDVDTSGATNGYGSLTTTSLVAPPGAVSMRIFPSVTPSIPTALTWYLDSVSVTASS